MLTRKGVYPYSYMDSFEKFEENCLPPRESFYDDLRKKHISDEDYTFIQELWGIFILRNLGELHDLYMETDVLLLTDIFEEFRNFSQKRYRLDPAHFNTAPALNGVQFYYIQWKNWKYPLILTCISSLIRGWGEVQVKWQHLGHKLIMRD